MPLKKKRNVLNKKNNQNSHTFLSAKVLTTCSPNFSQFGQAAANLELEMHVRIANVLLLRNREKLKFSGI